MELRISDDIWNQINENFGTRGGIYFLYCKHDNGDIIPTDRLLKTDPNGILYIGKAISFLERVVELKKSLSPVHHSKGHECGFRMKELNLLNKFRYENLFVRLTESTDELQLEKEELTKYELEFGELPPLNRVK